MMIINQRPLHHSGRMMRLERLILLEATGCPPKRNNPPPTAATAAATAAATGGGGGGAEELASSASFLSIVPWPQYRQNGPRSAVGKESAGRWSGRCLGPIP